MDASLDASKANREPFGTLIIYLAPVIPIAMFAATVWIDLSVQECRRGPPPKRPRQILKLVSHWLQREYFNLALRKVKRKKHIAALALLRRSIITKSKRNSSLVIA